MALPLPQPAPAVETAPVALAQLAAAEQVLLKLILLLLAQDTAAGVRLAASALPELRVVETQTLNSTTTTAPTMLVCGKLTAATGVSAAVVLHHAHLMPTLHAPRRCGHGVETHGNTGPPAENAAAAQRLLRLLSSSLRETPRLLLLFSDSKIELSFKTIAI